MSIYKLIDEMILYILITIWRDRTNDPSLNARLGKVAEAPGFRFFEFITDKGIEYLCVPEGDLYLSPERFAELYLVPIVRSLMRRVV